MGLPNSVKYPSFVYLGAFSVLWQELVIMAFGRMKQHNLAGYGNDMVIIGYRF